MTDLYVTHRPAFYEVCGNTWPTLPVQCALLAETSTYLPVAADRFVSAMTPGVNELVNDDYERLDLAGLTATWSTDHLNLTADTLSFGALASEHTGHGIKGVVTYKKVGDGTDDSVNLLLRTVIFGTAVPLTSESVVVAWGSDGVVTVTPG